MDKTKLINKYFQNFDSDKSQNLELIINKIKTYIKIIEYNECLGPNFT